MPKILITGGSGFIGSHLIPMLVDGQHHVVVQSRDPVRHKARLPSAVHWIRSLDELQQPPDLVVNFAGAPLAAKRWTQKYRQTLLDSRVKGTEHLVAWLNRHGRSGVPLLSGSAVGWYGDRGDEWLDEDASPGVGFASELCQRWEHAASAYRRGRVVLLRTGIVLGSGGALQQMRLPYLLGLGGSLAGGRQFWPWIHINDYLAGVMHLMTDASAEGPYNLVGVHPVRQATFAKVLASVLHRPAWMPMPKVLLRLIAGEIADLLAASQRCTPKRLMESGWRCRHPMLEDALKSILGR